jgi:hypothetical protein
MVHQDKFDATIALPKTHRADFPQVENLLASINSSASDFFEVFDEPPATSTKPIS